MVDELGPYRDHIFRKTMYLEDMVQDLLGHHLGIGKFGQGHDMNHPEVVVHYCEDTVSLSGVQQFSIFSRFLWSVHIMNGTASPSSLQALAAPPSAYNC